MKRNSPHEPLENHCCLIESKEVWLNGTYSSLGSLRAQNSRQCFYVCISMYVYVCLYVLICFCTFLCISIHFYTFLYISIHLYTFLCIAIRALCWGNSLRAQNSRETTSSQETHRKPTGNPQETHRRLTGDSLGSLRAQNSICLTIDITLC